VIEFTEKELLEFFRMVKPDRLNDHLEKTIETTRKVGLNSLVKLVDQQVLSLELFSKIKSIVENQQQKFSITN